jgi:F-type H+-transporting ATPase subunit gamma
MANPRALVRRRKSVQNTRKLTRTMEMVSTARLARAQHAAIAARPYAAKLEQVIGDLARASGGDVRHPLLEAREKPRRAWILLLASDRGLCGSFNANILRAYAALRDALAEREVAHETIAIGKKAVSAGRFQGWAFAEVHVGVSSKPSYQRAEELGNKLIARFVAGEVDEAHIVFSSFISMVTQKPRVEKILPLSALGVEKAKDPAPDRPGHPTGEGMGYLYHPAPAEILAEVLPLAVKTSLFTAMLENCAGEHAARRVAMKNATDAADEMIKLLTQRYNRARQGKITQEISEIVGGVEAL